MKPSHKDGKCACGCGKTTKGGTFCQGHDAKLKSSLLTTMRERSGAVAARAKAKLAELGWLRKSATA